MSRNWLPWFASFWLLLYAGAVRASIYTVNSTLDLPDADPSDNACATAPPNPVCTLRAAVMQANAHAGSDTILVPAGTYVLTLVGYDQTAALGDLDITDDVTIQSISSPVVIDANGAVTGDRAFEVVSGTLSIQGITIKNGDTPSYGGAIYAVGNLQLSQVTIVDNTAGLDGGGIYATGDSVVIESSVVQGNTTQGQGGGICYNPSISGSLVLTASEVAGNQALGGNGGGIEAFAGSMQVTNGWIHDNSAVNGAGGGLSYLSGFGTANQIKDSVFDHNAASASASGLGGGLISNRQIGISNTRFTNNSAYRGGGIYEDVEGADTLTDIDISGNTATNGAGIYVFGSDMKILRGRIGDNVAAQAGGAIYNNQVSGFYSSLTLEDSSVFGNGAATDGGGIWTLGFFSATTSAIFGNQAARGGAAYVAGTASFNDSTLDGNRASGDGGAVFADSTSGVKLNSTTITGNRARTSYPAPGSGGGVYIAAGGLVTSAASVLAYNVDSGISFSPNDCTGSLILASYNYLGTDGGCTTVIQFGAVGNLIGGAYPNNIDPNLSAFERLYAPAPYPGANASPKYGRVPLAGSPLIDAGPPGGCEAADGSTLLWDEIGQSRTINGRCDIGAVEYGAAVDGIFEDGFGG